MIQNIKRIFVLIPKKWRRAKHLQPGIHIGMQDTTSKKILIQNCSNTGEVSPHAQPYFLFDGSDITAIEKHKKMVAGFLKEYESREKQQ